MVDHDNELPPLRDFPPGRLDQRKEHLLAEISSESGGSSWWVGDHRVRPVRILRPVPLVAAAALAAILVVGVVLATRVGTTTASAAQVRAKLAQGLALAESIRGEYTVGTRPPKPVGRYRGHGWLNYTPVAPVPSTFVLGADGSYAVRALPRNANVRFDVAYDARTGVQTSYQQGQVKGLRLYVRGLHVDPAASGSGYVPEYELSAWVRQAVAAHDPHVKNVTFDRRRAWQLTLVFKPGDAFYGMAGIARIDAIVDRDTGLVLQVTRYAGNPNWWSSIETIRNLKLGTPTSPADFLITPPAAARVVVHDFGFHSTSPTRAAALLGYRPLLPTATGGRALTAFAVAKTNSYRLLPGFAAPVYRDVASARYGRGPNSVVVTTRRGRLTDVLPLLEGMTSQTIHLAHGALAGAFVQLSTTPPHAGYLAGYVHGLVVQVTAPSASEASEVADSLAAAR
jgi:hypothetical protein